MDRTIINFIDDLISKHGHYKHGYFSVSIQDLEDSEKEEFAAYLMKANHTYGAAFEWLDPEHEHLFVGYLLSSHPDDKKRFLDAITKQAVNYFEETMEDMLSERVSERTTSEYEEHGFRKSYDSQTGEVQWTR